MSNEDRRRILSGIAVGADAPGGPCIWAEDRCYGTTVGADAPGGPCKRERIQNSALR